MSIPTTAAAASTVCNLGIDWQFAHTHKHCIVGNEPELCLQQKIERKQYTFSCRARFIDQNQICSCLNYPIIYSCTDSLIWYSTSTAVCKQL